MSVHMSLKIFLDILSSKKPLWSFWRCLERALKRLLVLFLRSSRITLIDDSLRNFSSMMLREVARLSWFERDSEICFSKVRMSRWEVD